MSRTRIVGLLWGLGLWLAVGTSQAAVELPSGHYQINLEDLRVKVPGGYAGAKRTWYNGRWYFNDAWNPLQIEYDAIDGTVRSLTRNEDKYERNADGSRFILDERESIVPLEEGGFRWEDREGNWIEYNSDGSVIRYGNPREEVSLAYDAEGRRSGVVDENGRQVLWYEYDAGGRITSVWDGPEPASARHVEYHYSDGFLTEVLDVRGKSWKYEYELIVSGQSIGLGHGGSLPSGIEPSDASSIRIVKRRDPLDHDILITYNTSGRVNAVTQGDGSVTKYSYDYDSTRKEYYTQTVEPSGKVIERWYDKTSEVIRRDVNGRTVHKMRRDGRDRIITDARGMETVKHYDSSENLIGIDYPDGSSVSYTVDPEYSNVLEAVDENEVVTRHEYDDKGNLIRKTEAAGSTAERVTEYVYDAQSRLTDVKRLGDANTVLSVTHYGDFDVAGNPRTITDPEGGVHAYTYDNAGRMMTHTDPRGETWEYTYDASGNLLSETDPLENTVTYEYDAVGNRIKRIGPAPYKAETIHTYDARGRRTSITDALSGVTTYERNSAGQLIKVTDGSGRIVEQRIYDGEGHVTEVRDGAGNVTAYDYGLDDESSSLYPGQINAVQYPAYTERYAYDKRNRPTLIREEYDGTTRSTKYSYDDGGRLYALIDAKNRTVGYGYDALGRRTSEIDPATGTTRYDYDDRDNLISVTNARNISIRRYEYDRNNRLTKEIRPDSTFHQYIYDDATGTTERIDAKGQKTRYLTDAARRLKTIEYYAAGSAEPAKIVSFSHDERGLLTGYDDGNTSAIYTYDLLGRRKTETVNYGTFTLSYSYEYDKAGRKTAFTGPDDVTVTYAYDTAGRPSTISLPGVGTMAYTEFTWQRPAKLTLPGGGQREWDYDGLMRTTQIIGRDPAGNAVLDYSYEYDSIDNIVTKSTEHGNYGYTYDDLDRLIGVDNPGLADEAYTYDPVGNRKTDARTEGEWSYSESDELESYDGVVLSYDDNGSLTRKTDGGTVTKYIYNPENRLTEVRDGTDNLIASYYYDPFGRRLWKEAGGSRIYFFYADEGLIAEVDEAGDLTRQYGWRPDGSWETDPLYLKTGGQTYFFQNDHLGSPQKLVSANGAVVWSALYESFGTPDIEIDQSGNPLRLPGQYFDAETGFHYNYFRYYDPGLGRYISSDPVGLEGGLNFYTYALSNPIVWADPSGLDVKWKGSITAGGVVVGIGGVVAWWDFTSECKCNKQVVVDGFASFLVLGAGGKGGSSGGLELTTPGDCPNASDFNGPAFMSGINAVAGVGTSFLSHVILGRADSGPMLESGPSKGFDMGLFYTVYGHSAVWDSETKECCS